MGTDASISQAQPAIGQTAPEAPGVVQGSGPVVYPYTMTFVTVFLTLLLIMDPFGSIPVFLSQLKDLTPGRRRLVIVRELVIALVVLALFLWFGQNVLSGLHLDQPALQISGGVILFLIALKMIFPGDVTTGMPDRPPTNQVPTKEPLIVPLAVPLVAGPSAMAYVILISTQYPERRWEWLIGLALAWLVSVIVLLMADALAKWLGDRVITAIERLMGMILTTLAVQMLLDGLRSVQIG
jgi:multiple antibiotic resistance protein